MTSLVVLGSGSRGNAIALQHEDAVLLIDAGFSMRELERRLQRAGLDPDAVVGIALTHEHGDHASGALSFARNHQAAIATSPGTWQALSQGKDRCDFQAIGMQKEAVIGPFTLSGCPTSHDAAEPVAVGIRLPNGLSLGVAYDLGKPTEALRWFLSHRHGLILEANHDETLLRTSTYPIMVKDRIAGPGGHLSNRAAARLLEQLCHEQLELVLLAHLSQRCNSPEVARATVESVLRQAGFRGNLELAEQAGPMPALELAGPSQGALAL